MEIDFQKKKSYFVIGQKQGGKMKKKLLFCTIFLFFILFLALGAWLPTELRLDIGDLPGAHHSGSAQISSSGNNVYVVWEDIRNGKADIYFNSSKNGGLTWKSTDVRLDAGDPAGASNSFSPQISSSGNNVYVAWGDYRNSFMDIYFNYSKDGGATWQSTDTRIDTGDPPGMNPSVYYKISSSGSNVYVVWGDTRNGGVDIFFNYSTDWGTTWQPNAIRIDIGDPPGVNYSSRPQISCSGNNVYVTWEDDRNGMDDIYFNYSTDGGATWQPNDIRIDTGDPAGANPSMNPQICCSGSSVYVVWQDLRNNWTNDIYMNYSPDWGTTWQPNDIRIDTGDPAGMNPSTYPQICCSGSKVYVVWGDYRNGPIDIYLNYSSDWGITWQPNDIRIDTGDPKGASYSRYHQISCSRNNVYIVWEDSRNNGSATRDIYLNYSTSGGLTWQLNDIRLNTGVQAGASYSRYPQISSSRNNVYIVWEDDRNGDFDIYFNAKLCSYYFLSISASKGGTTLPMPGTQTYEEGTEVKIEAFPDDGYRFGHWSGDVIGTDNPITITMDSDKSIKANFIRQYMVTIEAGSGGTTNPAPGSYIYDKGTKVAITAIPDAHYQFSGWSGDKSDFANPITVRMNSDKSLIASFVRVIYSPLYFTAQKVLNRSLSQAEYINVFTWQSNPNNMDILKYRIYLIEGENKSLLVELDAGTFQYLHRKVEKDKQYTYLICAVNDENKEGYPAYITVQ